MISAYNKDSVSCKDRKAWQDEHKGEQRTCKGCGETMLVYNESKLKKGFRVNPNTYKGVRKVSPALTCLSCNALARKTKKAHNKKIRQSQISTFKEDLRLISEAHTIKIINNLWQCSCAVWNRGSRDKCKECGKKKVVTKTIKVGTLKQNKSMCKKKGGKQ